MIVHHEVNGDDSYDWKCIFPATNRYSIDVENLKLLFVMF